VPARLQCVQDCEFEGCRPPAATAALPTSKPSTRPTAGGSVSDSRVSDLTAGKLTPKLSVRIADVRGRQLPTHSCRTEPAIGCQVAATQRSTNLQPQHGILSERQARGVEALRKAPVHAAHAQPAGCAPASARPAPARAPGAHHLARRRAAHAPAAAVPAPRRGARAPGRSHTADRLALTSGARGRPDNVPGSRQPLGHGSQQPMAARHSQTSR